MKFPIAALLCVLAIPASGQQLLINEFLAAPNVGDQEFVEILVLGDSSLTPGQIRIRDSRLRWTRVEGMTSISPGDTLLLVPDTVRVTVSNSARVVVATLSPWPTLNNGGDSLIVHVNGQLSDRVGYNTSKRGVSWERISPLVPGYVAQNWALSSDPSGATPGRANTRFLVDSVAPRLLGAEYTAERELLLWFSEILRPGDPVTVHVLLEGGVVIFMAGMVSGSKIRLVGFVPGTIPTQVTVRDVKDYTGNASVEETAIVARAARPEDIIFSEIHFLTEGTGPASSAPEFIELLSLSDRPISLRNAVLQIGSESVLLSRRDSTLILNPNSVSILSNRLFNSEMGDASKSLSEFEGDPFLEGYRRAGQVTVTRIDGINLRNSGNRVALLLNGEVLDEVWYSQDMFDERFDDHRARSIERRAASAKSGWSSCLLPFGISPGIVSFSDDSIDFPGPGDLLITEIMFNPLSDDFDNRENQVEYLEFINVSERSVNLWGLSIANPETENGAQSPLLIGSSPVDLESGSVALVFQYPGAESDRVLFEHSVLSRAWPLRQQNAGTIFLPLRHGLSLSRSGEILVLLSGDGTETDRVAFNPGMHHPSITSGKGIAIERPLVRSGNTLESWNFAAFTSSTHPDGGTPGYVTAWATDSSSTPSLSVRPRSFYPEYAQLEHESHISIISGREDAVIRIDIYSDQGRHVRVLSGGRFLDKGWTATWDGRDDGGILVNTGLYVVVASIYRDSDRRPVRLKQVVAVLRGLR